MGSPVEREPLRNAGEINHGAHEKNGRPVAVRVLENQTGGEAGERVPPALPAIFITAATVADQRPPTSDAVCQMTGMVMSLQTPGARGG